MITLKEKRKQFGDMVNQVANYLNGLIGPVFAVGPGQFNNTTWAIFPAIGTGPEEIRRIALTNALILSMCDKISLAADRSQHLIIILAGTLVVNDEDLEYATACLGRELHILNKKREVDRSVDPDLLYF